MQSLQEATYNDSCDYRAGSPHLMHWELVDRFVALLEAEVEAVERRGLPLTMLDVGAGHGGYTEPALARGCSVTVTEMSRPSLERMTRRYGRNPRFTPVFDDDGSLRALGDRTFSVVLCSSVLHHIPDYHEFVEGPALAHLARAGTFVSLQDPIWYPDMARADMALSKAGYYSWRLIQGNYRQGLQTRWRRLCGIYDENNPADMVEYHVVRNGVDVQALEASLSKHFEEVTVLKYWSSPGILFQRLGTSLKRSNTFAIIARGHSPAQG